MILEQQRHGKFGTNSVDGIDVPRIVANVADEDWPPAGGRRSGNTLAHRNAPVFHHFLAVAHGETIDQHLAAVIEKHYGKDLVIDQALDERGHFGKNAVQIQRSINLFANLCQGRKDAFRQLLSKLGFHVGHAFPLLSPGPTV